MSLKELLAAGRLRPHKTGSQEIEKLFAVVDRDMKDARVAGLSADRRFTIAYNAVLQTSRALLAARGYRTSGQGHHAAAFLALRSLLPKEHRPLLDYFDDCRSKRNLAEYTGSGVTSEQEAADLVKQAETFSRIVRKLIKKRHP